MFGDVKLDLDQIVSITVVETAGFEIVHARLVQRGVPGEYNVKPAKGMTPKAFVDEISNLVSSWCAYKLETAYRIYAPNSFPWRLSTDSNPAVTSQESLDGINSRLTELERIYAMLRDYLATKVTQ
jgi:hypothetical protein